MIPRPPSPHSVSRSVLTLACGLVLVGAGCSGGTDSAPDNATPGGAGAGTMVGSSGAGAPGAAGGAGVPSPIAGTTAVGGAQAGAPSSGGGGGASGSAASGGVTAMAGTGGANASGAGGSASGDDPLPSRPLAVTAEKARHQHTFRAKAADPTVSFNDNNQIAVFDNRAATLMRKLVLPFAGQGVNAGTLTGGGEFCAKRGFHVLAIATFQDYDIVSRGADFFGNARRTAFEGVLYTHEGEFANIAMTSADGVAQRTQKALQYLHATYPEEDWGYYLQPDGSVRWSDVIFTGMSHGASNAARFGFLVRASRVVSASGPRDNLCTKLDLDDCGGVIATWYGETPKTPIDRFFAISGTSDAQHTQHLFAMEKLGYTGKATSVEGAAPPYGNTHRMNANSGHTDFCGVASYAAACNYAFGVPPENQAGTGP